jgi:hypothetical protein
VLQPAANRDQSWHRILGQSHRSRFVSERVPVDFWDQPSTAVLVPISAVVAGLCHGADVPNA